MKRTPLYDEHVKAGAKLVEFAGWEMPVRYNGIVAEHQSVRNEVGLFDVSHMGEIWVRGPEAEAAVNSLTTNDVRKLKDGKAQYSAILNEEGGVIDDIIVYRVSQGRYLICVNASNADADFAWMKSKNKFDAEIDNASAAFGQIAVQGPKAVALVQNLIPSMKVSDIAYFHFAECVMLGVDVILARTGYTGEDGFEIFVPAAETSKIWQRLLAEGAVPCGLGARDSLRLEAALPLHGHELGTDISALESGIGWVVKLDKGDFIGREPLAKQKAAGIPRMLVGFEIVVPGIARQGDKVFSADGQEIGIATSGSKTPTVNRSIGMAFVKSEAAKVGTPLQLQVRGNMLAAKVIEKPFYKRSVL